MTQTEEKDSKTSWQTNVQTFATLIQVMTVVAGVVISILSFNYTKDRELKVRELELQKYEDQRASEAERRKIEAAKPFLELRQQKYMETIKVAGVLATPADHSPAEIKEAEKRFAELYYAELALVEVKETEAAMVALANELGRSGAPTPMQQKTLELAHVLRDSLRASWRVDDAFVGPVNQYRKE